MIKIFRSKYKYTIRGEDYIQEAWFVEQGDQRSQPLTWYEVLGHVVQVLAGMNQGAPIYWENNPSEKYEFIGEKF